MVNSNTRRGVISTDDKTAGKLKALIKRLEEVQHQPKGTTNRIMLPKGITKEHFTRLRLRISDPTAKAVKACKERLDTFSNYQFIQYWFWGFIKIKWPHSYIVLTT